jgi:hypothetical protein
MAVGSRGGLGSEQCPVESHLLALTTVRAGVTEKGPPSGDAAGDAAEMASSQCAQQGISKSSLYFSPKTWATVWRTWDSGSLALNGQQQLADKG